MIKGGNDMQPLTNRDNLKGNINNDDRHTMIDDRDIQLRHSNDNVGRLSDNGRNINDPNLNTNIDKASPFATTIKDATMMERPSYHTMILSQIMKTSTAPPTRGE